MIGFLIAGRQESQTERLEDAALLALKMKDGAMRHGVMGASIN